MKIAILGSGGREHALVNQMSLSKKTTKIYCIPGNAGTCHLAENVNLNLDNFESIYDFCFHNKVPLVLASTGHNDTQINKLKELSKIIPILHAPNLSMLRFGA